MLTMVVAGGLAAIQAAFNARLSAIVGNPIQASFISFIIGALALGFLLVVTRQGLPAVHKLTQISPHYLLGGLCGAVFITCAIFLVPRIGVVNVLFLGLAGQMIISVAIDNLGLFNLEQQPLTLFKIIGLLFIIVGVVFLKSENTKPSDFSRSTQAHLDNIVASVKSTSPSQATQTEYLNSLLPSTLSKRCNFQKKLVLNHKLRMQKKKMRILRRRLAYQMSPPYNSAT